MRNGGGGELEQLTVNRQVRLTETEDQQLIARAVELDRTYSWVIRDALRTYLAKPSTTRRKHNA